jgi:exodeoxyribonuclease VII large subunit
MNKMNMNNQQVIYDARTLGTGKVIVLGLQHMFAMFGATVLVPLLTGLDVSTTLLFAGLGTLLFHLLTKKKIPAFPNNIGVISAPQGAAVRDVITTIRRRWPIANITLLSALVQGAGAAPDVLDKLIKADNMGFDTIIIARGGGSIEDLWCFNDESVARFVATMKTPTISAIGHETDFTILDFVADIRAATPTAAAEIATPNIYEVLVNVESNANRMKNKLIAKFDFYNEAIKRILQGEDIGTTITKKVKKPMFY